MVPSTVDPTVVASPTLTLRIVASIQIESPKYVAYHRKEKPGGGKTRYGDELNDNSATITIGSIRNAKTSTQ
jgi:hypothetical protein